MEDDAWSVTKGVFSFLVKNLSSLSFCFLLFPCVYSMILYVYALKALLIIITDFHSSVYDVLPMLLLENFVLFGLGIPIIQLST